MSVQPFWSSDHHVGRVAAQRYVAPAEQRLLVGVDRVVAGGVRVPPDPLHGIAFMITGAPDRSKTSSRAAMARWVAITWSRRACDRCWTEMRSPLSTVAIISSRLRNICSRQASISHADSPSADTVN